MSILGLVYKDAGIDKICTNYNGAYGADLPANINIASRVLDLQTTPGMYVFQTPFYKSRTYSNFRVVEVSITLNDSFDIHNVKTNASGEKIVYVSNDDLDIVAYRSGTYQVVTVASLLASEIPNVGELSFADMEDVVAAAATLTMPQIKYLTIVPDDTVAIVEIVL